VSDSGVVWRHNVSNFKYENKQRDVAGASYVLGQISKYEYNSEPMDYSVPTENHETLMPAPQSSKSNGTLVKSRQVESN
jgi:hypothetical protein